MIAIPISTQVPYVSLAAAATGYAATTAIGYVLGTLDEMNPILSASVLAIATLANFILFKASVEAVHSLFGKKLSPEAVYTGSNAAVSILTILAAKEFELISGRLAGFLIFGSLALLMARISILAERNRTL